MLISILYKLKLGKMKTARLILFACLAVVAIVACEKDGPTNNQNTPVPVSSVAINPTGPITLAIGDEVTLTATIAPENATNKQVTWSSDNSSVATVTDGGVVRALAVGTAIITAKAEDKVAICRINVEESVVEVTSVTVAPEGPLTATVGDSITFTATVMPEDATDRVVTWTSSNPELASIDDNGVMSAIAAGQVTIIASAGTMSASVEVTIENVYVAVTDIITNVEGDLLKLHWGETFQLELSVVPENATEQTIDYSFLRYNNDLEEFYYVKESEYLTVSEDGLITVFECNGDSVVGEMIVMSAGDYTEELPILISLNEEEPILPEGWTVNGNTATYKVNPTMDFDLVATFENEVCKTVRFTTLTRESRATDIEAVFPESVLDAFTITGRGTVATIDLLLVAGCKEYFENLTMAEMFAAFGDNTSAILTNWTTSFSVTNLVTGNWEMPDINTLRERVNGGKVDGFSTMRVLVTYNEITGTVDSTTWTIGFETEEIATNFLQLVKKQNEVLYNRFADYIREELPREPIFHIDVTDIFPASDQSAMEDVLSTTDVCLDLLGLAVGV